MAKSFSVKKKKISLPSFPILDLLRNEYKKELTLFRSHHKHRINKWIHLLTVPIEWFSSFLLLSLLLPSTYYWMIVAVVYIYYCLLNSKKKYFVGSVHVVISCLALWFSGRHSLLRNTAIAIALQLFAWVSQIGIGHSYFEKNSPSMTKKFTFNSIVVSLLLIADN